MSNQINDGGPAFPHERHIKCNGRIIDFEMEFGMTLRDYFAAAIMQGMMASQCEVTDDPYPIYAYKIADAMLKAREVKP